MQIYIKNTFVGYHRWKDAPDEVKFLRAPHRHIFHVKTTIEVDHADRELEFFMVQRSIDDIIKSWSADNKVPSWSEECPTIDWSCETMATELLKELHKKYPRRMICDISEDDENGAVVTISEGGVVI